MLVSIKQDLYDLGAPDTSGFPAIDTDDARLIVAAFGKDGPPVAAKRLTVKGRQFPVTVELTVDDLAFPLTKVSRRRRRRRTWVAVSIGDGWGCAGGGGDDADGLLLPSCCCKRCCASTVHAVTQFSQTHFKR